MVRSRSNDVADIEVGIIYIYSTCLQLLAASCNIYIITFLYMYEQGIFTSAFSKDTHKYARWAKLSYFLFNYIDFL